MQYLLKSLSKSISYSIKTPIDLGLFKNAEGIDVVRQSLKARFRKEELAQNIQKKLQQYRKQLHQIELLNKKVNKLNSQIKNLMTVKNLPESACRLQEFKKQMTLLKAGQKNKESLIKSLVTSLENSLLSVGNIVHKEAPVSADETNNKCLNLFYPYGKDQSKNQPFCPLNKSSRSYQEINEHFQISDLKRGQKVSGHRGFFLKHNGIKLAFALTNYALDFLEKQSYSLFQTPMMICESALRQNCQLQTIQNDMYKLQGEGLYLIATSEQSLAAYYKGEVLDAKQLPIKMGGYSSCFRKQAGAHGKDIHGLFRVHQFEKIEQFVICEPEKSNEQMKRMAEVSSRFYQSLGIPYRVVDIVSGQLNDAAIRKFDLEGWYPSQKKYRQLVSISNCTNYQSRLANISYRKGSQTQYVHMLNGTLTAVERTLTCIMENFFDSDKKVFVIPQKLQKYFGKPCIQMQ